MTIIASTSANFMPVWVGHMSGDEHVRLQIQQLRHRQDSILLCSFSKKPTTCLVQLMSGATCSFVSNLCFNEEKSDALLLFTLQADISKRAPHCTPFGFGETTGMAPAYQSSQECTNNLLITFAGHLRKPWQRVLPKTIRFHEMVPGGQDSCSLHTLLQRK